jgi:hypothetical protein
MSKDNRKLLFSQIKKENEELTAQLNVKGKLLADCYNDLKAKLELVKKLEINLKSATEYIETLSKSKEEIRLAGESDFKKVKILEELLGEDARKLREEKNKNLTDKETNKENIKAVKKLTEQVQSLQSDNALLMIENRGIREEKRIIKQLTEKIESLEEENKLLGVETKTNLALKKQIDFLEQENKLLKVDTHTRYDEDIAKIKDLMYKRSWDEDNTPLESEMFRLLFAISSLKTPKTKELDELIVAFESLLEERNQIALGNDQIRKEAETQKLAFELEIGQLKENIELKKSENNSLREENTLLKKENASLKLSQLVIKAEAEKKHDDEKKDDEGDASIVSSPRLYEKLAEIPSEELLSEIERTDNLVLDCEETIKKLRSEVLARVNSDLFKQISDKQTVIYLVKLRTHIVNELGKLDEIRVKQQNEFDQLFRTADLELKSFQAECNLSSGKLEKKLKERVKVDLGNFSTKLLTSLIKDALKEEIEGHRQHLNKELLADREHFRKEIENVKLIYKQQLESAKEEMSNSYGRTITNLTKINNKANSSMRKTETLLQTSQTGQILKEVSQLEKFAQNFLKSEGVPINKVNFNSRFQIPFEEWMRNTDFYSRVKWFNYTQYCRSVEVK